MPSQKGFDNDWQPDQVHHVDSDSSSSVYVVWLRSDGKHQCNCTGFATKRNKYGGFSAIGNPGTYCKHIKRLVGAVGPVASSPTIDPKVIEAAKQRALELRKQLATS